ncbi:MAG TPA: futalosine hydrolase [Jatrophihabitantaceae bacterium]|nr:futalosine hydrolase [Jatrophihabitantaceae bacterium]
MNLLVVTAVDAERAAVRAAAPNVHVIVGGVGPATAAASTAAAIATGQVDLVLSAGIAGGFAPTSIGSIAVASACVFADLGVETDDGFVPVSSLGFGIERYDVSPRLAVELADVTGGHMGTVLTVATVTGTASTAAALQLRHPDAIAEAMEGAGIAAAATAQGIAFAEVRAISNVVGPRRRDEWDVPGALDALGRAIAAIAAREWSP